MAKRTEVTCRICKSFLHSTEQHKKASKKMKITLNEPEKTKKELSSKYWEGRGI